MKLYIFSRKTIHLPAIWCSPGYSSTFGINIHVSDVPSGSPLQQGPFACPWLSFTCPKTWMRSRGQGTAKLPELLGFAEINWKWPLDIHLWIYWRWFLLKFPLDNAPPFGESNGKMCLSRRRKSWVSGIWLKIGYSASHHFAYSNDHVFVYPNWIQFVDEDPHVFASWFLANLDTPKFLVHMRFFSVDYNVGGTRTRHWQNYY